MTATAAALSSRAWTAAPSSPSARIRRTIALTTLIIPCPTTKSNSGKGKPALMVTVMSQSAPAVTKNVAVSACPLTTAWATAVVPSSSLAFMSAPLATSARTTCKVPGCRREH